MFLHLLKVLLLFLFANRLRFWFGAYLLNSYSFVRNRSIKWQLKKSRYDRALRIVLRILRLANAAWKLRFAYRAVLKKTFSKGFAGFRRFVPLPVKFKNISYRRRLKIQIRRLFFDRNFNSHFRFRKRVFQFILSNTYLNNPSAEKKKFRPKSRRNLQKKNVFFQKK